MLTFPTHLFNPVRIAARPMGSTVEGGESLSGLRDVIRSDGGGYWSVNMMGIQLIDADTIRAWRAWESELQAGVTRVIVPISDVRQAPRPVVGGKLGSPSQLEAGSDDPYFPEAVGFATPWIVATITDPAALRAVQLTINVERGARLKGGEHFSIDHATAGQRLYRVRRVTARDGQEATVLIEPPLREAVADNTAANFDWPGVVCVLVPGSNISPELEGARYASIDIAFREAL